MNYETILREKRDNLGFISFNRPKNYNTFNLKLAQEFNQALLELDNDPAVRVIIVKGEGKAFCAGIDLNELDNKSPLEHSFFTEQINKINLTMADMKKPVIACVHKFAVANGVGIVASADLALASEDTQFGTTAINVGLFCMGPAVPLYRCIGRKKALEMLFTGDMIDAQEAERIGLINKVVPKEKLEEETLKLAQKIAAKSPLAIQIGKRSLYKMADLEFHKAIEIVNQDFALLCTTEDAREGITAFHEKREPNWQLK